MSCRKVRHNGDITCVKVQYVPRNILKAFKLEWVLLSPKHYLEATMNFNSVVNPGNMSKLWKKLNTHASFRCKNCWNLPTSQPVTKQTGCFQILLWNPSTSTRIHKYTACFIAGWFFNCQNIADYGWQVWQYQSASCAVTSIRKSQHIMCTPQKKISLRIFPDRKSILMWGGGTNSDTEISHLLVCFKQVLSDHKMVPTIFVEKHEIQNKL